MGFRSVQKLPQQVVLGRGSQGEVVKDIKKSGRMFGFWNTWFQLVGIFSKNTEWGMTVSGNQGQPLLPNKL